jgi:hypothetical protein
MKLTADHFNSTDESNENVAQTRKFPLHSGNKSASCIMRIMYEAVWN